MKNILITILIALLIIIGIYLGVSSYKPTKPIQQDEWWIWKER